MCFISGKLSHLIMIRCPQPPVHLCPGSSRPRTVLPFRIVVTQVASCVSQIITALALGQEGGGLPPCLPLLVMAGTAVPSTLDGGLLMDLMWF